LSSLSLFSTVSIGTREAVVRLWLVGSQSLDTEAELSIASCSMFNEGTTINPARCTANSCVPTIHAINDRTSCLRHFGNGVRVDLFSRLSRTQRCYMTKCCFSDYLLHKIRWSLCQLRHEPCNFKELMQENDIFSHRTFGEVPPPLYRGMLPRSVPRVSRCGGSWDVIAFAFAPVSRDPPKSIW
jgi:hypothetical protein